MTGFIFPTPAEITYEEGIYVGYRYFDRSGITPLFPFGYGLSYSEFGMKSLSVAPVGHPQSGVWRRVALSPSPSHPTTDVGQPMPGRTADA